MKDDRVCLRHILECLDAVRTFTAGGADEFINDRRTRKAVLRELQELAESTQRISPALKERHQEIPWRDISGFRNVLVHDYLGLSLERIWNIIQNDLPSLRATAEAMLRELNSAAQ